MDTELPPPSHLRFFDILNAMLLIVALLGAAVVILSEPKPWSDFLINVFAGLVLIPLAYSIPRLIFRDRTVPTVREYFHDSDEIYERAKKIVDQHVANSEPGAKIRIGIYAPVGIGVATSKKDTWLQALAVHAKNKKVHVDAVFGLPPEDQLPDCTQHRLEWFADAPSVELRVIPPAYTRGSGESKPIGCIQS